jgi:hypothetical protein
MGLCNRGKKRTSKNELRLQAVEWTNNQRVWTPQTDDVYIPLASAKIFTQCCPGKYAHSDGKIYQAFPVFEGAEWDRIRLALGV